MAKLHFNINCTAPRLLLEINYHFAYHLSQSSLTMINDTQIQYENNLSSSKLIEPDYFCESLLPELEWQEDYFLSTTPSPKDNLSSSNHFHKKLNHNAYERDRRKKLNSLYLSLRTLLPESERSVSTRNIFFLYFYRHS